MFPHPPLRTGLATFTASGSPGISGFPLTRSSAHFTSDTRTSPSDLRLMVRRTSIPWRPSPCRRLSRPPSTMTPPTPMRFNGGLLPSTQRPPTFILIRSTRWCRQGLHATNPAHRGILNGYGVNQVTHIILWAGNEVWPASVTFRFVHWPIGQGIEPGASFPVG